MLIGMAARPASTTGPNPRPAAVGTPIPVLGRIGNRGFPNSRFWPNRESGIPDSRKKTGIGGKSGII